MGKFAIGAILSLCAITLLHAHLNLHLFQDHGEDLSIEEQSARKTLRVGHLPVT